MALTSPISRPLLPAQLLHKTSVINSGFNFFNAPQRIHREKPSIAYLGTVDFKKLHRGIIYVVDALDDGMAPVSLRGQHQPGSGNLRGRRQRAIPSVSSCVSTRSTLCPSLAEADIFLYPLRRNHYGSAENALVEAMSMGLVPVVLDNPVETKIVAHGKSGFVAHTIDECVSYLRRLSRWHPRSARRWERALRARRKQSHRRALQTLSSSYGPGPMAERGGVL